MYLAKSPYLLKKFYQNFVWNIPTEEKIIYLTFDDGPTPTITNWVLHCLKEHNALATFFCVGDNVAKYPSIFNEIIAQNHSVGNHTFNHLNGWKTNNNNYLSNIKQCEFLIKTTLFRPPYGRIKKSQYECIKNDYNVIMWDVLSGDFDPNTSNEKCLLNVLHHTEKGSIIVFHDSLKGAEKLIYTLPKVLAHFTKEGYTFKKL